MPRVRTRHVAFCVAIIVCFYYFFPQNTRFPSSHSSHGSPGASEEATAVLARYMNDPRYVPAIRSTPSSFDWSSVNFTYPLPLKPGTPAPIKNRPRIQHTFKPDDPSAHAEQEARRLEVKRVFEKSWASYKRKAWMKDALKPISGGYVDQFSGWAATLVDSLDTLWIMGMRDEFYEAVEAVAKIDFGSSTSPRVNTFETCIR